MGTISVVVALRLESYEAELEAARADRAAADSQLTDMRETIAGNRLDTTRLQAALATSREKVGYGGRE